MSQPGNSLGLLLEMFRLVACQVGMEYLDCCLQIQPYMLPKVDLSMPPCPNRLTSR